MKELASCYSLRCGYVTDAAVDQCPILGVFGLVIVFGLGTVVSGLWQIITGRRNRWIAIVMLGMIVLLVIAGSALRKSLGA